MVRVRVAAIEIVEPVAVVGQEDGTAEKIFQGHTVGSRSSGEFIKDFLGQVLAQERVLAVACQVGKGGSAGCCCCFVWVGSSCFLAVTCIVWHKGEEETTC